MTFRDSIGATALVAALLTTIAGASAQDATKYPDWSGKWIGKIGGYDPSKPPGRGQEAPLTAEYQAIFEAGLADYAAGGQGNNPTYLCIPPGMPRMAHGRRAELCGLFHRQVARHGWNRPLRHARSRDPQYEGPAHFRRRHGHSSPQG